MSSYYKYADGNSPIVDFPLSEPPLQSPRQQSQQSDSDAGCPDNGINGSRLNSSYPDCNLSRDDSIAVAQDSEGTDMNGCASTSNISTLSRDNNVNSDQLTVKYDNDINQIISTYKDNSIHQNGTNPPPQTNTSQTNSAMTENDFGVQQKNSSIANQTVYSDDESDDVFTQDKNTRGKKEDVEEEREMIPGLNRFRRRRNGCVLAPTREEFQSPAVRGRLRSILEDGGGSGGSNNSSPFGSQELNSFRTSGASLRRMSRSMEALSALRAVQSIMGHSGLQTIGKHRAVPPLHSNSDEDGDDEEDEDEGYGNGNYAVDSVTQFREAVLDNLINGSIRRMTLRRMTLARGEMQGLEAMGERWENKALEICEDELGATKFMKRISKHDKVPSAGFGSKTRLKTIECPKIKKAVTNDNEFIRHYNAVGAVGYARILEDERIPVNEFFVPGKRFRVRLRHSNLRSDDDASSCQRETAIKFADQNEDGPLDLIMFTGRVALARNCKTFLEIIKLKKPADILEYCYKNPNFFFALVDSLRRAPESFSALHYYSQVPYKFIPKKGNPLLCKFRLIPENQEVEECGQLEYSEQCKPWDSNRHSNEDRSKAYLRTEFLKLIESEPVHYRLQIQIRGVADEEDDSAWNPQTLWDELQFPWIDLAEIKLTTPLTCSALKRTYYNITDKPPCLKFPSPVSIHDYRSYHYVCCTMYTTMEIKRCGDPKYTKETEDGLRASCGHEKVTHVIGVCTGGKKDLRPRVDIYIALTGTHGRSTPKRLDDKIDEKQVGKDEFVEYFQIVTEPIGEILTQTIGVRHRHLTDDWYLRYTTVARLTHRQSERRFPCHSVILSKATLRPGEVSLPQSPCHEVLKQERLLEIRERQQEYIWQKQPGLPSKLRGSSAKDLPPNEQVRADKFSLLLWDVDTQLAEVIRPMINTANSHLNHTAFSRLSGTDDQTYTHGHMRQISRQKSTQEAGQRKISAARKKWMKIKHAISFIAKVKLPDGPQGEMCRLCQDDKDFGRTFLIGSNPGVIQACPKIPDNFAVMEEDLNPFTADRDKTLTQALKDGHIFLANYSMLSGLPCYHQDADHRYLCAPMCLLYVNHKDELVPIAIQLEQEPGPHCPVWTPRCRGEEWLLAKLWVRCADFHHQLMISHLLKCRFVVEPFCVAMLRQLSTSHPVYKLLKPHFRYFLPTNTLLRKHLCEKSGAMDKWTSLGSEGFRQLTARYYRTFSFDELDMPRDMMNRGVENSEKLPGYLYRDDGLKLWNAIGKFCFSVITHSYTTNDDVEADYELQNWIRDVNKNGFPAYQGNNNMSRSTTSTASSRLSSTSSSTSQHLGEPTPQPPGLPKKLTSICELADLVTKILFTATAQHNATTAEAMDLYGFLPLVPAIMRHPPPTAKRGSGHGGSSGAPLVGRELIVKTLPIQSPEAYYGSMAYVMAMVKADTNSLGSNLETYFVEPEIQAIKQELKAELGNISAVINARNAAVGLYSAYDMLLPEKIPNSPEPLPFCPLPESDEMEDLSSNLRSRGAGGMGGAGGGVPLMTLPICMQFARNMGGRSFIGRRLTVNMFSQAMSNANTDRVNAPMQAMDRKRYHLSYGMYGSGSMMMM